MGITLFFFLGAVSCAVGGAIFYWLAVLDRDKGLARIMAATAVAGCVAAFFLGRML